MPFRSELIAALVAGAVAFAGGWAINGWRLDARLSRAEERHAKVLEQLAHGAVAAAQAARAEEARRTAAVEEQRDIAQAKLDGLALELAAGAAVSDRMRRELDALRRRGGACSAAATDGGPGQQGTDTIGLLIDMLEGMESAGREVAEYADRVRIAGAACEGAWEGLNGPKTTQ